MTPARELRYYASIPKSLLYMLIPGSLIALFGHALLSGAEESLAAWFWLGLVLSGALALLVLIRLILVIFIHRPVLQINGAGFTHNSPMRPKQTISIPWSEAAVIGIRTQELGNRWLPNSFYFLAVYEYDDIVDSDDLDGAAPPEPGMPYSATVLSSPWSDASLRALLNSMYVLATRKRRSQMLERIKTTFAPEISRYSIAVDEQERPL